MQICHFPLWWVKMKRKNMHTGYWSIHRVHRASPSVYHQHLKVVGNSEHLGSPIPKYPEHLRYNHLPNTQISGFQNRLGHVRKATWPTVSWPVACLSVWLASRPTKVASLSVFPVPGPGGLPSCHEASDLLGRVVACPQPHHRKPQPTPYYVRVSVYWVLRHFHVL